MPAGIGGRNCSIQASATGGIGVIGGDGEVVAACAIAEINHYVETYVLDIIGTVGM